MRIVDAVQDGKQRFLKHLLIEEDGGCFRILDQVTGHVPQPATLSMTEEDAFHEWETLLLDSFFLATGHRRDSEMMAARRIKSIH